MKRTGGFACTPEQRLRVARFDCIVCGRHAGKCHPAHLIDRSLAPTAGRDVRAVVPLCPQCHIEYDEEELDLSPYLEPEWRDSVAWAVEAVGLWSAVRRITNRAWGII